VSNETDGFLDDGVREMSPSAKFSDIGDSVKGEVVDKYTVEYIPFGKKDVEIDDRTGEPVKQLVVVLQTDQRDWEGVSKVPVDKDSGVKLPGSKDTGRRAVYARKGTNIYSALAKSVAATLPAGEKPGRHPLIGSKFGIQFFEEEDTGKGNPLKKFRAKYELPVSTGGDTWFDEGASSEEPADGNPAKDDIPASKPAKSLADEEPPF
jgi:hypothetical protein